MLRSEREVPNRGTYKGGEALTDPPGSRAAAGGKKQTTGKAGRHRFPLR